MNYRKKYQLDFINAEGTSCRVDFYKNNYDGGLNYLTGGSRPFVLREFNTDLDFYKPIRPQQAEIEILADNVTIEEFIAMEDNTWQVQFYVDGTLYWYGWLLQDDFQEDWINTSHIITLRATEGLGSLKNVNLTYQSGQYTFFEYIGNAVTETALYTIYNARIVNNLFYSGMSDGVQDLTLAQAYINNNSFETGVNTYEDYNSVIEKINRAWNMTIFQYQGVWWLVRMSEYLLGANIRGVVYTPFAPGGNDNFLKKFDASVGVNERIKPIVPNMLRTLTRPANKTKVIFKYVFPSEILCNQSFQRGTKTLDSSTERVYTVDCWSLYKTNLLRNTASTAGFARHQELDNGKIKDDYVRITDDTGFNYMSSESVTVVAGNKITISYDFKEFNSSATGVINSTVGYVVLEADSSNKYTLDDDGTWYQSNSSLTAFVKSLHVSYTAQEFVKDWKNFEITSKAIPESGVIYIYLYNDNSHPYDVAFKNVNLTIDTGLRVDVTGDYDQLNQGIESKNNFSEETYFDDGDNPNWKGSIFSPTNVLTGDRWYRYGVTEALTFKREKALAHWQFNKRYRSKLDVNMFGLMWDDSGTLRPIGLANTFVFTDDDPSKQWMILNLQEIDFAAATWKATLIEVYDSEIDTPEELVNYPEHTYDFIYE